MRTLHYFLACSITACLLVASNVRSQENAGERIGGRIGGAIGDAVGTLREEAGELAGDVRKGFEHARAAVDRMSIEARLYARLRWDKTLNDATLEVDVDKEGTAVLEGTVSSEAAKAKAGQLAEDTVSVVRVVNDLKVVPPSGQATR